jgi:hypothetical protein
MCGVMLYEDEGSKLEKKLCSGRDRTLYGDNGKVLKVTHYESA